jgi:tetratricopeptide (TPR) repeat protein
MAGRARTGRGVDPGVGKVRRQVAALGLQPSVHFAGYQSQPERFLQIMDDYKWTDAANLSHYYTGIIYLKQGKFQDAIDQLKDFNGKDKMVTNMAYGAIGDSYAELGNMDDAVDYYKKAAYHFENDLTSPMFLKKAAMLLERVDTLCKDLDETKKVLSPTSWPPAEADLRFLLRGGRQRKEKCTPFSHLRLCPDTAAVGLYNPLTNRQT